MRGWSVGDLELAGHLAQGHVTLTAETQGKDGRSQWQGQVTLSDPPSYEATVRVRQLDLTHAIRRDSLLATDVNFDAWAKGRGLNLKEADGAAKLTLLPSRLGSVTGVQGQAAGTLRDGRLALDRLTVRAPDTTLTVHGRVSELSGEPHGTPA